MPGTLRSDVVFCYIITTWFNARGYFLDATSYGERSKQFFLSRRRRRTIVRKTIIRLKQTVQKQYSAPWATTGSCCKPNKISNKYTIWTNSFAIYFAIQFGKLYMRHERKESRDTKKCINTKHYGEECEGSKQECIDLWDRGGARVEIT